MINSRSLDDLTPETKQKALKLIDECAKQGITIKVTSTFRDFEEQDRLYSLGRTTKNPDGVSKDRPLGKIVTNSKAGQSWHNFKVAFDVVPIVDNKAIWNDTGLFRKIGAIGKKLGLTWGGDFRSFIDLPHFQNNLS